MQIWLNPQYQWLESTHLYLNYLIRKKSEGIHKKENFLNSCYNLSSFSTTLLDQYDPNLCQVFVYKFMVPVRASKSAHGLWGWTVPDLTKNLIIYTVKEYYLLYSLKFLCHCTCDSILWKSSQGHSTFIWNFFLSANINIIGG